MKSIVSGVLASFLLVGHLIFVVCYTAVVGVGSIAGSLFGCFLLISEYGSDWPMGVLALCMSIAVFASVHLTGFDLDYNTGTLRKIFFGILHGELLLYAIAVCAIDAAALVLYHHELGLFIPVVAIAFGGSLLSAAGSASAIRRVIINSK